MDTLFELACAPKTDDSDTTGENSSDIADVIFTSPEIPSISKNQLPPSTDLVLRRSKRDPNGSLLQRRDVKQLLRKIRKNHPDTVVLKLKDHVTIDINSTVMDKVIKSLKSNKVCQALYIQNLNRAIGDDQLKSLLDLLKAKMIWCLNIGENYNLKPSSWEYFCDVLPETNITHLYVSEHVIKLKLKNMMRANIRENRKKHDKHCSLKNIRVIQRCTNMWWNPINSIRHELESTTFKKTKGGKLGRHDATTEADDDAGTTDAQTPNESSRCKLLPKKNEVQWRFSCICKETCSSYENKRFHPIGPLYECTHCSIWSHIECNFGEDYDEELLEELAEVLCHKCRCKVRRQRLGELRELNMVWEDGFIRSRGGAGQQLGQASSTTNDPTIVVEGDTVLPSDPTADEEGSDDSDLDDGDNDYDENCTDCEGDSNRSVTHTVDDVIPVFEHTELSPPSTAQRMSSGPWVAYADGEHEPEVSVVMDFGSLDILAQAASRLIAQSDFKPSITDADESFQPLRPLGENPTHAAVLPQPVSACYNSMSSEHGSATCSQYEEASNEILPGRLNEAIENDYRDESCIKVESSASASDTSLSGLRGAAIGDHMHFDKTDCSPSTADTAVVAGDALPTGSERDHGIHIKQELSVSDASSDCPQDLLDVPQDKTVPCLFMDAVVLVADFTAEPEGTDVVNNEDSIEAVRGTSVLQEEDITSAVTQDLNILSGSDSTSPLNFSTDVFVVDNGGDESAAIDDHTAGTVVLEVDSLADIDDHTAGTVVLEVDSLGAVEGRHDSDECLPTFSVEKCSQCIMGEHELVHQRTEVDASSTNEVVGVAEAKASPDTSLDNKVGTLETAAALQWHGHEVKCDCTADKLGVAVIEGRQLLVGALLESSGCHGFNGFGLNIPQEPSKLPYGRDSPLMGTPFSLAAECPLRSSKLMSLTSPSSLQSDSPKLYLQSPHMLSLSPMISLDEHNARLVDMMHSISARPVFSALTQLGIKSSSEAGGRRCEKKVKAKKTCPPASSALQTQNTPFKIAENSNELPAKSGLGNALLTDIRCYNLSNESVVAKVVSPLPDLKPNDVLDDHRTAVLLTYSGHEDVSVGRGRGGDAGIDPVAALLVVKRKRVQEILVSEPVSGLSPSSGNIMNNSDVGYVQDGSSSSDNRPVPTTRFVKKRERAPYNKKIRTTGDGIKCVASPGLVAVSASPGERARPLDLLTGTTHESLIDMNPPSSLDPDNGSQLGPDNGNLIAPTIGSECSITVVSANPRISITNPDSKNTRTHLEPSQVDQESVSDMPPSAPLPTRVKKRKRQSLALGSRVRVLPSGECGVVQSERPGGWKYVRFDRDSATAVGARGGGGRALAGKHFRPSELVELTDDVADNEHGGPDCGQDVKETSAVSVVSYDFPTHQLDLQADMMIADLQTGQSFGMCDLSPSKQDVFPADYSIDLDDYGFRPAALTEDCWPLDSLDIFDELEDP